MMVSIVLSLWRFHSLKKNNKTKQNVGSSVYHIINGSLQGFFFSKPTYRISSCMSRSRLWAEPLKVRDLPRDSCWPKKKSKTTEFSNCLLMPNLQLQTEPCFSFCLSNTVKSQWAYRWRIPYVCRQEITCMHNKGTLSDSTSFVVQSSIYLHIKSCFSFHWRPIIVRLHMWMIIYWTV